MENILIRSFSEEFDKRECSKKFFCFYVSSILLSGSLTLITTLFLQNKYCSYNSTNLFCY